MSSCQCPGVICNLYRWSMLNALTSRQNGRHFPDDIFKCIFLNENAWISIKIPLKFVPMGQINNIPALVQIMACRLVGAKPLSEPMVVTGCWQGPWATRTVVTATAAMWHSPLRYNCFTNSRSNKEPFSYSAESDGIGVSLTATLKVPWYALTGLRHHGGCWWPGADKAQ